MLNEKHKELIAKLELDYQPVALKYVYLEPEGIEKYTEVKAFCQIIADAQQASAPFYIGAENDNCAGKAALGLVPPDGFAASGQMGPDIGMFETTAPNARVYEHMKFVTQGAHRFVIMAPVAVCDFSPDIIMFVAPTEKAEIIMRATSWVSGDVWESHSTSIMSCAWMYAYPYTTGKPNFCITGMHHGLARRKMYPAGLHMIAIPYQKMPEFFYSLENMPWVGVYFRTDEEGKQLLADMQAKWAEIGKKLQGEVGLK